MIRPLGELRELEQARCGAARRRAMLLERIAELPGRRWAPDRPRWCGRIVTAGPQGQPDWPDERYWVRRQLETRDDAGKLTYEDDPLGPWVTATNQLEFGLPESYQHLILGARIGTYAGEPRYVTVVTRHGQHGSGAYYIFESLPVQIATGKYYFDTSSVNGSGCTVEGAWRKGLLMLGVYDANERPQVV